MNKLEDSLWDLLTLAVSQSQLSLMACGAPLQISAPYQMLLYMQTQFHVWPLKSHVFSTTDS